MFKYDVLSDENSLNGNILGKFYSKFEVQFMVKCPITKYGNKYVQKFMNFKGI